MTMPAINDPGLPGLRWASDHDALAQAIDIELRRTTSAMWRCNSVTVVRFRHRAGNRAILQLDLSLLGPDGLYRNVPGAFWLYSGNKAKDAAKRMAAQDPAVLPTMIFEPQTSGLLTLFPHDRRVPEIARFIATSKSRAVGLTGSESLLPPELARYRPGLGATFRWRTGRGTSFVKVFKDRPASERYAELAGLYRQQKSEALATPIPQGFDDELGVLVLKQAPGEPLANYLGRADSNDPTAAIDVVLGGLAALNHLEISPRRKIDSVGFLKRAAAVVKLLAAVDDRLSAKAALALDVLVTSQPSLQAVPSHADMKIEHVLIDGKVASFLDLDSLALSDPLYDPAMLAARIELAGQEGALPDVVSLQAIEALRGAAPAPKRFVFDWLFCVARFQTARFLVQNSRPNWRLHVTKLLDGIIARVSDPVLSG